MVKNFTTKEKGQKNGCFLGFIRTAKVESIKTMAEKNNAQRGTTSLFRPSTDDHQGSDLPARLGLDRDVVDPAGQGLSPGVKQFHIYGDADRDRLKALRQDQLEG